MAYQERRYSLSDLTEHGGGASLTNVNTTTFVAAKVGNGAQFVAASSQRLDSTDTVFDSVTTESITMWGWLKLDSTGVNHGICGQGTSSYHCHVISTNKLRFRVNRTIGGNVSIDYTGTFSSGVWYFFIVEFDYENARVTMEIDRTGMQQQTFTQTGLVANTGNWSIGSIGSSNYCNGIVDEIGFRRGGLLSGWEKDAYFNAGPGRSHTEMDALRAAGPYIYQDSMDSHGGLTSYSLPVRSLVEGYLAVVFKHTDGAPTGMALADWDGVWTSVDSDQFGTDTHGQVWKKVLTALDVAETTLDFSWTGTEAGEAVFQIWANASDIDVFDLSNGGSSTSTPVAQSITTTVNGCALMFGMMTDGTNDVSSSDAPYWSRVDSGTSGGETYIGGDVVAQTTAGSTGTRAFTLTGSASSIRFSIAIAPLAGGITVDASAADGMTLADTAAGSIAALVSASDGIVLSDAAAATLGRLAAALDGVTLTDTATVSLVLSAAAADGLSLSDVAAVVTLFTVAASDGLRFSDSASASIVIQATASDGWAFSDSSAFPTGAAYAAATLSIANAIAATLSLQNAISATLNIKPD